jgi:hypothetical protein
MWQGLQMKNERLGIVVLVMEVSLCTDKEEIDASMSEQHHQVQGCA